LSDRPTRPAPPARPEAMREAFRCPVYGGFPGCLRGLLPLLGAWRGRSSPQCNSAGVRPDDRQQAPLTQVNGKSIQYRDSESTAPDTVHISPAASTTSRPLYSPIRLSIASMPSWDIQDKMACDEDAYRILIAPGQPVSGVEDQALRGAGKSRSWQQRRTWLYRTEHVTAAAAADGVYPARTLCCRTEWTILCDRFPLPTRPSRLLSTPPISRDSGSCTHPHHRPSSEKADGQKAAKCTVTDRGPALPTGSHPGTEQRPGHSLPAVVSGLHPPRRPGRTRRIASPLE
jgi:hypothetical protein